MSKLDLSLDELASSRSSGNRSNRGRNRRQGGQRNGGEARNGNGNGNMSYRNPLSRGAEEEEEDTGPIRRGGGYRRSQPYSRNEGRRGGFESESKWKHDMYQQTGGKTVQGGSSILISNLANDVTEEDLEEIFGTIGSIKSCAVNYDREGNSKGSAEVEFSHGSDATKAVEEYDQAKVDGRPMYIKIVGELVQGPRTVVKRTRNDSFGNGGGRGNYGRQEQQEDFGGYSASGFYGRRRQGRGGARGQQQNQTRRRNNGGAQSGGRRQGNRTGGRGGKQGGGRGGKQGGGRGNKRQPKKTMTAEELDAELDAYQGSRGGGAAAAPAAGGEADVGGFDGQPSSVDKVEVPAEQMTDE